MNTSTEGAGARPDGVADARPRRARWPAVVATGALIVAVGAGGFAFGAVMPWHGGWSQGAKLAMIQYGVRTALDSVGATAEQEGQVHDIVAKAALDVQTNGIDRDAVRKQMLDLFRAPQVDRAAVERLRVQQVAKIDALSKTMVGALVDAAAQLSPDQRGKLADRWAAMARHHHWGHPGGPSFDDDATPGQGPAAQPDGDAAPDHG